MLTVNSLQLSAEFQHEINPNLKKIELHSDVTASTSENSTARTASKGARKNFNLNIKGAQSHQLAKTKETKFKYSE